MRADYVVVNLDTSSEIVIALLSDLGFDSFWEDEDVLKGYIKESEFNDILPELNQLASTYGFSFSKKIMENKNWNAIWEAEFKPVIVEDFCTVRATFHHLKNQTVHQVIIDPKMAFGTGHHQTTYMMIKSMRELNFKNKIILDYGAGTGILSILAEKLGSSVIDAVDIEELAFENMQESITLNNCHKINVFCGDIHAVSQQYDCILANINRNVLLDTAEDIRDRLKVGGELLMSGVLQTDKSLILEQFNKLGFNLIKLDQKDQWMLIRMRLKM